MNLGSDSLLELCRATAINRSFIKHRMCVCSLWPHDFLKTFKIIPWRIWAWIHFKPWCCLRSGQHKDMCQKNMWVYFMSPFPYLIFYLFASSTKISQKSLFICKPKWKPLLRHELIPSQSTVYLSRKYGIGFLMLSFNKVTNLYDVSFETVHCLRLLKRSRERKLTDK